MSGQNKNVAIDLMRGVSIFYIVGYWHLLDSTNYFPGFKNPLTHNLTVVALSIFVFLSGFLLAGGVGGKKFPPVGQFFKTRFMKIYPPFALTAVIFFLFHLIDLPTFLKTLTLVSMFWGPASPTIWFIGMIAIFYALTPFLIKLADKSKSQLLVAACVIFGAFYLYASFFSFADKRLLLYFPSFILGIWVARFGLTVGWLSKAVYCAVFFFCVGLLALTDGVEPQYSPFFIPLAMSGALLVFYSIKDVHFGPRMAWFAEKIAAPSYMLFLVHRPVYAFMKRIYFPGDGFYQALYLFAICLPVAYLAARFAHHVYEVFFNRYFAHNFKKLH